MEQDRRWRLTSPFNGFLITGVSKEGSIMKRILFVLALCLSASVPAPGTLAADQCEKWEQARERIYEQLRKGHSASRGNKLHARLRELDALIAHNCR
jgi:hypothetical protein